MTTLLTKKLKRQITIDGVDYTLAVGTDGLRVTGKGKRTPEVDLRWSDLLSGEAAMAVALNASLTKPTPAAESQVERSPAPTSKRAPKKPAR